jgi:hypothetical protein
VDRDATIPETTGTIVKAVTADAAAVVGGHATVIAILDSGSSEALSRQWILRS